MAAFRIDVDTELSRKQRRRLQAAALRWHIQLDPKLTEVGPWRQDWGVQYECRASTEAEARARFTAALGEDLGERIIITRIGAVA